MTLISLIRAVKSGKKGQGEGRVQPQRAQGGVGALGSGAASSTTFSKEKKKSIFSGRRCCKDWKFLF